MKKGKISFFGKNLFLSLLSLIIVGSVLTIGCYLIQQQTIKMSIVDNAKGLSKVGYNFIDTYRVNEIIIGQDFDVRSSNQKTLMESFRAFQDNPDVAQAYVLGTEIKNKQNMAISLPQSIIDAGLTPGSWTDEPPNLIQAIEKLKITKKLTVSDIYSDKFGTWITVLNPIENQKGEVIAYFGMDLDASIINKVNHKLLVSSLKILSVTLLAITILQFFAQKKLLSPLKDIYSAMDEVSNGNLGVQLAIKSRDELGQLSNHFNKMTDHIRRIVTLLQDQVQKTANEARVLEENVSENTHNVLLITQNIQEIAVGSNQQLTGTTECSIAMDELSKGVQRISESMLGISTLSSETSKEAESGNETVEKAIQKIEAINNQIIDSANVVKVLGNRSEEIVSIVDVITEISSQTNLLALNAAIEAARAGEHGKGFAVVADEVRKLAEQSEKSANKISKLIQDIQTDTTTAIMCMNQVSSDTHEGLSMVKEAGNAFDYILSQVKVISDDIQEVSAVSEEISASSEEISASLDETANIANLSSEKTNEVANTSKDQLESIEILNTTAQNMTKMAKEISSIIKTFKV